MRELLELIGVEPDFTPVDTAMAHEGALFVGLATLYPDEEALE